VTNLERQISVQVANTTTGEYDVRQPLPYPYHVGPEGVIGRQDFWKGEPARLIGFQSSADVQRCDVYFTEFWENPEVAVGKFPIFSDAGGGFWNHRHPVTSVTVHAVSETSEVL
jgi:hypothetical protein